MYENLEDLFAQWDGCQRCGLCEKRTQTVFGFGNANARLMVISDKPGLREDETGIPMTGAAGDYYRATLKDHGLTMKDVWTTNCVACITPENRDPFTPELEACRERLHAEILLVDPDVIVLMGGVTVEFLLGIRIPVSKIQLRNFPLLISTPRTELLYPCIVTYNPAWIRKNPAQNRGSPWHKMHEAIRRAKFICNTLEDDYESVSERTP